MSDYHILEMVKNGKSVRVVFHVPVPAAGTNQAGISWRDAIVKSLGGSANIVSVLTDISVVEDTGLKSGAIIEILNSVRFSSIILTNPQRKSEVEAKYNVVKSEIIATKQVELTFMGFSADVP